MNRGIMRWSPMRDIERFFEEDFWSGADFVPAMDVYQDKDNVIVETSVAGIDPEKIEVNIENDVLTVSGVTMSKQEVKREDYYRKEIREGSFSRSVILPMHVKGDQAEAECKNGILRVTVPKSEEAKPKKISVKVS